MVFMPYSPHFSENILDMAVSSFMSVLLLLILFFCFGIPQLFCQSGILDMHFLVEPYQNSVLRIAANDLGSVNDWFY